MRLGELRNGGDEVEKKKECMKKGTREICGCGVVMMGVNVVKDGFVKVMGEE